MCSSRMEDQGIRHARLAIGNSQPDLRPSHLAYTTLFGAWPGSVRSWDNIADAGDIVALVKDLRPGFGPRVQNRLINNGASAHNLLPYLTARETGDAIAAGLA